MKKTIKLKLSDRIVAFVNAGHRTVSDVLAEFGKEVSAASASRVVERRNKRYGKRRVPLKDQVEVGRRNVLANMLIRMAKCGKIRRVSLGVYGPVKAARRAV